MFRSLLATLLVLPLAACHRIDDPPLPESHPLAAFGVRSTQADGERVLPPEAFVEPAPIIAVPDDDPLEHGVVKTFADAAVQKAAEAPVVEQPLDLRYDPSTEITIRGPVLGIHHVALGDGHTAEMVEIQPGADFMDVMLATTKYAHHHGIDVSMTDPIMVTGSVLQGKERPLLLARELTWRGKTYQLRDAKGHPAWRTELPSALAPLGQATAKRWWW